MAGGPILANTPHRQQPRLDTDEVDFVGTAERASHDDAILSERHAVAGSAQQSAAFKSGALNVDHAVFVGLELRPYLRNIARPREAQPMLVKTQKSIDGRER